MPDNKTSKLRERMQKMNADLKKAKSGKVDIVKNANDWMDANREMKKVGKKPAC